MKMIPEYLYQKDSKGSREAKIPNNPLSLKAVLFKLKTDYEKRWDKTTCQKTRNRYTKVIMRINASLERGYIPKNSSLWAMVRKVQQSPITRQYKHSAFIGQYNIPLYKNTYTFISSFGSKENGIAILNKITKGNTKQQLKEYIYY
jgi:hypothetical protein